MTNILIEMTNSLVSTIKDTSQSKVLDFDILSNTDSTENSSFQDITDISKSLNFGKSYCADSIIVSPEHFSQIKLSSLSEFMQREIFQYQIGKWNNISPNSIYINFPLTETECPSLSDNSNSTNCNIQNQSSITLDKLTFQILDNPKINLKSLFSIKDHWPLHGVDLLFKPEEGLTIRSLLGLELDQELKYLTNKELPATPQSTQSSLFLDLSSLNSSELFYKSENLSQEVCSISSQRSMFSDSELSLIFENTSKSVEDYHKYINKNLPSLPAEAIVERNTYEIRLNYIRKPFEIQSIILEENSETQSVHSTNSDVTGSVCGTIASSNIINKDPYSFSPNYEYRSEILNLLTESERNELDLK